MSEVKVYVQHLPSGSSSVTEVTNGAYTFSAIVGSDNVARNLRVRAMRKKEVAATFLEQAEHLETMASMVASGDAEESPKE